MSDHLLIRGDARHLPLADQSVHMVACSPPYFGLRDYGSARWVGGDSDCDHRESEPSRTAASTASSGLEGSKETIHASHVYRGNCGRCGARRIDRQIGLEPTPDEFVAAMRAMGREVWRVLRDDGSWWLNLGDSFANDAKWGGSTSGKHAAGLHGAPIGRTKTTTGLKPKDLCMVPERVALALQSDGWYLRAKPPWFKPNPMPDSTTDRPNVAHESIFLLTKAPRYYFDMEAVRVPSAAATIERDRYSRITSGKDGAYTVQHDHETPSDPGGRHLRTNDFFTVSLDGLIAHQEAYLAHLKHIRDDGGLLLSEDGEPLAFWQATRAFKGSHFATWPIDLVRPMILASTSEKGCCPACGAPWCRVTEHKPMVISRSNRRNLIGDHYQASGTMVSPAETKTLGWELSCSCDAGPPVPCVVLDNFNGAGTTALAAVALGRRGIGVDLNGKYLAMSARRIERPHAATPQTARSDDPLPLFDAVKAISCTTNGEIHAEV